MSRPKTPRLSGAVKAALDRAGLSYEIRSGTKHFKLFVEGQMITVLPHGSGEHHRHDRYDDRRLRDIERFIERRRA